MSLRISNRIDSHSGIIIQTVFFGITYLAILVLNHISFNTSIYDLGINTNALYDYSRLGWNDSLLLKSSKQNLLGEHFDLYLILLAPLSYFLKSYTLIFIQAIALSLGGLGIYKYFYAVTSSRRFANAAALYFFLFFGVFSSLLFSYESYAVASMIIPWFFYFFHKERFTTATFLFLLIIISRESISLWMAVVCLGMIANYYNNWRLAKKLLELALISFLYYMLVTEMIMPAFSTAEKNIQFEYSGVGETYLKSVGWIIAHPVLVVKMLLFNHLGIEGYDYTKIIFIVFGALSGGIFLIFRPQYIIMLIPVYFSKLLSDHVDLWGINGHYCIQLAPIFTLGIFSYFSGIWQIRLRRTLIISTLIISSLLTVYFIINTSGKSQPRSLFSIETVKNLRKNHEIQKAINTIPITSPVSAEYNYVPHLAYRDYTYVFPDIRDASYIVISKRHHVEDSLSDIYHIAATDVINSREWTIEYQNNNFYIMKRANTY